MESSAKRPRVDADAGPALGDGPARCPAPEMVSHNGYMVPADCNFEVGFLDRKNGSEMDRRICFQESGHNYYVDGRHVALSVTEWVGGFFRPFDAPGVARQLVRSAGFASGRGRNAQYRGIVEARDREGLSEDEVASRVMTFWEEKGLEASELGTRLHEAIEIHYNTSAELGPGYFAQESQGTLEWCRFMKYHDVMHSRGFRPYRTEMRIFSERYAVCGSVDMIFVDGDGEFRLRDWKRSASIGSRGYGYALAPFQRHGDGNFTKYSIQLHVYKAILELEYGMRIKDMAIVAFHPSLAYYEERSVANLSREVAEMFSLRERDVALARRTGLEGVPGSSTTSACI